MSTAAVILDVDGTLVDSNDAHARAWLDAFAEAGIEVDAGRVRRAIGMGGDKLLPHVAAITEDSPLAPADDVPAEGSSGARLPGEAEPPGRDRS